MKKVPLLYRVIHSFRFLVYVLQLRLSCKCNISHIAFYKLCIVSKGEGRSILAISFRKRSPCECTLGVTLSAVLHIHNWN